MFFTTPCSPKLLLFIFCLSTALCSCPIHIQQTPIAFNYLPKLEIEALDYKRLLFIGERTRISSCTGVAWLKDGRYLMSANLMGCSAQIYELDKENGSLKCIRNFSKNSTIRLAKPENLSVSSDKNFLAISNGLEGRINIYRLNPKQPTKQPELIAFLQEPGNIKLHGVRFSRDTHYLAYVTFDVPAKIYVYKIENPTDKTPRFRLCQELANPYEPLKPKGIDFSPDGRFIAICYSMRASFVANTNYQALVATYPFDSVRGEITLSPISLIGEHLSVSEDVLFFPDSSCILVSNQGNDTVTVHEFNAHTGELGRTFIGLQNPQAKLSFPHGMSLTSDGTCLALSNYGDHKVTVYSISKE